MPSNDVDVLEHGKVVLPKEAFNVFKKLKGKITLEINESNLIISKNKTKLEFPVMDANEYPAISAENNSKPLILSGSVFSDIVTKTTFATSKSEVRPILQAVNMTLNTNDNVIVSTDSHRLSRVFINNSHEFEDVSLSIPASILDHAHKSFDLSQDVMIIPGNQSVALANGSTILMSTLLQGAYPDTSRLIPTDFSMDLTLNRNEFIDGLELLQSITPNNILNLTVNELFAEIKAQNTGTKGIKEIAYESYNGEEGFSISFSAQYVLDALKCVEGNSIRLRFNGSDKPFIIVPVDESYQDVQLVLPVRQS